MIYIGDYNTENLITDKPVKAMGSSLMNITKEDVGNFWVTMGGVIGSQFDKVKNVLSKYGYQVNSKMEAVSAISRIQLTDKWKPFFNDLFPVAKTAVGNAIAMSVLEERKKSIDESWALDPLTGLAEAFGSTMNAFGQVGSSIGNAQAAKQQAAAAQANAQAQMVNGLALVAQEREKRLQEEQKASSAETRNIIIIIVALLFIIGTIITVVLLRRRNRNK